MGVNRRIGGYSSDEKPSQQQRTAFEAAAKKLVSPVITDLNKQLDRKNLQAVVEGITCPLIRMVDYGKPDFRQRALVKVVAHKNFLGYRYSMKIAALEVLSEPLVGGDGGVHLEGVKVMDTKGKVISAFDWFRAREDRLQRTLRSGLEDISYIKKHTL